MDKNNNFKKKLSRKKIKVKSVKEVFFFKKNHDLMSNDKILKNINFKKILKNKFG